jgi:2TM domain
MTTQTSVPGGDLRQMAVTSLRKKRGLQAHALAYIAVNLFLNVIWFLFDRTGFYWPIFPMFGWGIGLAFNIWDVYSPQVPTEKQIDHEMQRLSRLR